MGSEVRLGSFATNLFSAGADQCPLAANERTRLPKAVRPHPRRAAFVTTSSDRRARQHRPQRHLRLPGRHAGRSVARDSVTGRSGSLTTLFHNTLLDAVSQRDGPIGHA